MLVRRLIFGSLAFAATFVSAPRASFCQEEYTPEQRAQDETIVETVLRLDGFDLNSSAKGKAAVLRYLQANPGTPRFFELVKRFSIPDVNNELLKLALAKSDETAGVDAARLLLEQGGKAQLQKVINGKDDAQAVKAISVVGLTTDARGKELIAPLLVKRDRSTAVRSAALKAVGRMPGGQQQILHLVQTAKLSDDLKFTAANVLLSSANEKIRLEAARHLQLPATKNAEPLPPLAELAKRKGDAEGGAKIFNTTGTCIKCHKVGGQGKEVGPDLSEIGSKLSREALLVSILDPSAGISHNYESYQLILDSGIILTGLLVSETDQQVTLRSAESIDRTVAKSEIDEMTKQSISLMPSGLQQTMTVAELTNLVEYLTTLKKSSE